MRPAQSKYGFEYTRKRRLASVWWGVSWLRGCVGLRGVWSGQDAVLGGCAGRAGCCEALRMSGAAVECGVVAGLGALRESLGWACGWGAVSACWATSESRCVVGRSSVPGRVLGLFVRD
jgi:hypothetical protein